MDWIREQKQVVRLTELVLVVVAMLGPWGFDLINVPAQYPCSASYVRLEGDFCGYPLTGAWLLGTIIMNITSTVAMIASETAGFGALTRELLVGGGFVFVLGMPFLSTLALIPGRAGRYRLACHLAAWSLALGVILLMGRLLWPRVSWASWGLWFFALLAAGVLALEIILLVTSKKTAVNS